VVFPSINTQNKRFFLDEWCALINYFVSGGSVDIKINDDVGRYFQTLKGL
jgi:hypothetical protein